MSSISHKTEGLLIDTFETGNHAVERTISAINSTEERLANLLVQVAATAARTQQKLTAGQRLNSLGEFQRTAVEADMLICQRQQLWETLGWLVGDEVANQVATGKYEG